MKNSEIKLSLKSINPTLSKSLARIDRFFPISHSPQGGYVWSGQEPRLKHLAPVVEQPTQPVGW